MYPGICLGVFYVCVIHCPWVMRSHYVEKQDVLFSQLFVAVMYVTGYFVSVVFNFELLQPVFFLETKRWQV